MLANVAGGPEEATKGPVETQITCMQLLQRSTFLSMSLDEMKMVAARILTHAAEREATMRAYKAASKADEAYLRWEKDKWKSANFLGNVWNVERFNKEFENLHQYSVGVLEQAIRRMHHIWESVFVWVKADPPLSPGQCLLFHPQRI